METGLFIYFIACYSVGAVGLALALIVSLAKPSPLERSYVLFMVGFTFFTGSMTVASFLTALEDPNKLALAITSLVNISSCCLIPASLARFIERLSPWRCAKAFRIGFDVASAATWALILFLYFTSWNVVGLYAMMVTMFASILYATIHGQISKNGMTKAEVAPEEKPRWEAMMRKIKWIAVVFAPLFAIYDFFPEAFRWANWFVHPLFKVAPLFYAAWNVLYVTTAAPTLFRKAPEAPKNEAKLGSFDLSPREAEIALMLVKGASYKEIASSLGISLATVKTHIVRVYQKTGTGTKIDLLRVLYPDQPNG